MKQFLYVLMALCAVGLLSCRKSNDDINIQQFDADQIQTYIKNNNLTGMVPIKTAGDTTGIYYQVITPGTGKLLTDTNRVAYLFSVKSFDGSYNSTDTILNHDYNFPDPGYINPSGLQLALRNTAMRKGAKFRVLIPSRLAYGINGTTISKYVTYNSVSTVTIKGNQCLDYTVSILDDDIDKIHPVDKIALYDDISIQKYLAAKGLTNSFTKINSGKYAGVYYRITKVGTGTDAVKTGSVLGVQYTGYLLNDAPYEQPFTADGLVAATTIIMYDDGAETSGLIGALLNASPAVTANTDISIIVPSKLGNGLFSTTSSTVSPMTLPAFSCLHYEMTVVTVSN